MAREDQETVMQDSVQSKWFAGILAGAMLGAALAAVTPAAAQTYDPKYPVCMTLIEWGGGPHIDCSFTSIPQCKETAAGRAAQCDANPYYGYRRNYR
jgi:hypothetical protein